MVDLETWRLEEGGVNVRFVNNFPERRWSPNVSIIMPARLDRARNYSYLSFHHFHHFYSKLQLMLSTLERVHIKNPCTDNHNQYDHQKVKQYLASKNHVDVVGTTARYQLNVSIMRGTMPGLSYAIIPRDQNQAPRPRIICMISNLTTDQFGRQWP